MKRFFALSFAALGMACTSFGQVTFADISHSEALTQTSDAAPTTPDGYFYSYRLFTQNMGDFSTVTVTDPSSNVFNLADQSTPGNGYFINQSAYYSSEADLEAASPFGTYTYSMTGGTYGPDTATVQFNRSSYADATPYFANSGYTTAQNLVAGNALNLSWNGFDPQQGASNLTYFTVTDTTTNTFIYGFSGDQSYYRSDSVAGSLFTAGDSYDSTLVYSVRYGNGSTSTGSPIEQLNLITTMSFTVNAAPEPSAFIGLGLGVLGLIAIKRKA